MPELRIWSNSVISFKTAAGYLTCFSTGFSEGRYCYSSTCYIWWWNWVPPLSTVHQFWYSFVWIRIRLEVCYSSSWCIIICSTFAVMQVSSQFTVAQKKIERSKKLGSLNANCCLTFCVDAGTLGIINGQLWLNEWPFCGLTCFIISGASRKQN